MYFEQHLWKINLLNLNSNSLVKLIKYLKLNASCSNKILVNFYKKYIYDISVIESLSHIAKIKLTNISYVKMQYINNENVDQDNTIKWSIRTDISNIEIVAIPNNKNHYTLCVSSQIGCALKCSFCYTGTKGFKRNLKPYEIINQLVQAVKRINFIFSKKQITNIVFMGMGEPLLNIKNVLVSIDIMTHRYAYNINVNKITVSTSGLIPYMDLLSFYNIPLAISLHASNNKLRSDLMPINRKYSMTKLLYKCQQLSKNNKMTIEYVMLENINDSIDDALDLINLLKDIKCKICLIPFNCFVGSKYKASNFSDIIKFKNLLTKHGKVTTIRKKLGYKIGAACGQLISNI